MELLKNTTGVDLAALVEKVTGKASESTPAGS